MVDREKVIDGLQEAAAYFRSSFDAMYGTVACEKFREWVDAIEQAIALLKEQEPRVMTLEEYKASAEKPKEERDPVWEEWPGLECNWEMPNQAYGGYGISWRAWTSRPTDKQREMAKWDGDT